MRRAALAVLALALVAGCTGGAKTSGRTSLARYRTAAALMPCPSGVGKVPHLVLPCLGGGPDVVLDHASPGVPTLVNVYGSWCFPCQREMPVLAAFATRAQGKVALLGVDTEDEQRLALIFAADMKQHWPAVVDDNGTFMRHYSSGPPVTLLIDASGNVVHVQRGPFPSLAALTAAVKQYLGVAV